MEEKIKNFKRQFNSLKKATIDIDKLTEKQRSQVILRYESLFEQIDTFIKQKSFKTDANEIKFYKKYLVDWLFEYWFFENQEKIDRFEACTQEEAIQYCQDQKKYYDEFKANNKKLFHYHRAECCEQDKELFLHPPSENFHCLDKTHPSYIIAKLKLTKAMTPIVTRCIEQAKKKETTKSHLVWTGSKTDLSVLLIALKEAKLINDGKVSIKELEDTFSDLFELSLHKKISPLIDKLKHRENVDKLCLDKMLNAFLKKIN